MKRAAITLGILGAALALTIKTAERLFMPLVIDSQTIDHEAILTIIRDR